MKNLIAKFIICPTVVFIANILFPNQVFYSFIVWILITGFILAAAAYIMENLLLTTLGSWGLTAVDFAAATVIVFLSQFLFPLSMVTPIGAVGTAILLAITEQISHGYLLRHTV